MIKETVVYIDEAIVRANIRNMKEKARKHQKLLRPHFKTHQSAEIGQWFWDEGIKSCAVSSFKMADYFATAGWSDIMIAFPLNPALLDEYACLAQKISLQLFLSDENSLQALSKLKQPVEVFIELDTGYKRSGIDVNKTELLKQLIHRIKAETPHTFRGFAVHAGETYQAHSEKEILDISVYNQKVFSKLKQEFSALIISYGDTPSIMLSDSFEEIDELRPGNFVFFDYMQYQLGSCSLDDVGMHVDCPLVAVYPDDHRAVIHGGAVHLSKEAATVQGKPFYGLAIITDEHGCRKNIGYLESLSQEHGIVRFNEMANINLKPGESVRIIPVHSCLVADIAEHYTEVSSGRIISKF